MWIESQRGTFRIRDRRAGRVVTVKSGIGTKTAAKQIMTKLEADKLMGEFIDPRAGKVTVEKWVMSWWGDDENPGHVHSLKVSTRPNETGRIKNHIIPRIGHIQIGEFDVATDQWWISEMQADGLAPKTIRNVHGLLFQAMEQAVLLKKIRINPCRGAKLPELVHHEMRFLLEPEADRLIAALDPHWHPLIITLLGTGMRWAEAAGLRAGRVDLLGGTLRVEETLQQLANQGLVSVPPKTRLSRRTITLPMQVREALVPLVAARKRNEYLFTEQGGGPLRHKHFFKVHWMRARAAADLGDVRIHDLRHTHAAWLISDEVQLTAIQRRLGHSSISITSDIYGHLLPNVDAKLISSLERRLEIVGAEHMGSSGPEARVRQR